ncbi:MAG TPA: hypothetical protein VFR49_02215, partial [Solirubrobacteraceae bacterium]|nr:hypothetical protein [Solirubrobacteraceae bacterium]
MPVTAARPEPGCPQYAWAGAAARSGAGAPVAAAGVRLAASDLELEWSAEDDLRLLELAEAAGLAPA